jgi:MoaA/NifB/PqqE/SkfB family radical SAM enzyme
MGLLVRNVHRLENIWLSRHLRTRPTYLPVLLAFVTDRCNLKCRMCGVYEHDPADSSEELSTEEWKAVIDSAAILRTMIISFTGGEPLVRSDIFDLIDYTRRKGIAVHLCSNGTIIDEANASQLQEAGVQSVSVSVESATPEAHELLRGNGTFERALQGIRCLQEKAPDIRIGINYLITTLNYRNMSAMIPFAEGLGVHQIKFAPIHTNLLHRRKPLEDTRI